MPYSITLWTEPEQASYGGPPVPPALLYQADLEEVTLERQFLRPYREGRDILYQGRRIPASEISRVQVLYSDPSTLAPEQTDISPADVTDEMLNRDPTEVDTSDSSSGDRRSVFLVYGRWHEAVEAMRVSCIPRFEGSRMGASGTSYWEGQPVHW
jgi:hypothetical protein